MFILTGPKDTCIPLPLAMTAEHVPRIVLVLLLYSVLDSNSELAYI